LNLIVKTDVGAYAHEIGSTENFYEEGTDDTEIELYGSSSRFRVNDVKGTVKSISITGIVPLDARGLPGNNERTLNDVTFEIPVPDVPVPDPPKYTLAVENGSGGGDYKEGEFVEISALVPDGKEFAEWESVSGDGSFGNKKDKPTTFVMPANNVTITAKFSSPASLSSGFDFTVIIIVGAGIILATALFLTILVFVVKRRPKSEGNP
jgi:hypothetical protein